MAKVADRKLFYTLCQQVVDNMVANDIQEIEYGRDFGPVKAQHISAVIEILRQYGAVEPASAVNVFKATPAIYRLYYTREFEMLNREYKRECRGDIINCVLAAAALASAIGSVFSACIAYHSSSKEPTAKIYQITEGKDYTEQDYPPQKEPEARFGEQSLDIKEQKRPDTHQQEHKENNLTGNNNRGIHD